MKITLLPGIKLDKNGLLVNGDDEAIHLRQGDMDGACGPYCIAMALLALKAMGRHEVSPLSKIDYRTRTGKFFRELKELDPMILGGSSSEDLQAMISAHNGVQCKITSNRSGKILPAAKIALESGHPVIIDVRSKVNEELNHWTLAIGFSDDYLFLLDPGYELRSSNIWNATVTTTAKSTRFGYRYLNPNYCCNVEISEMIEIY